MIESWAEFHWLRPQILWALLPLLGLLFLLWRHKNTAVRWRALIDPALLPHLVDTQSLKPAQSLLWGLMLAWLIATLALAGPVWEQRPTPVHRETDALVLVLDLSPSMVAEDIKPTRIFRARLKIAEILKRRTEGEVALVVYAGDAHIVTPLTDDTNTINSLLMTLSPGIMPLPGSQTEAGIEQAIKMLEGAGFEQGKILLLTDGVEKTAANSIEKQLQRTNFTLSILGVGTDKGAPIPSGRGGFLRDSHNAIIITKLNSGHLQTLAQSTGGRYITSHFTEQDIDYLLTEALPFALELRETKNQIDAWVERGPWLILFILPLILYAFRRGVVLVIFIIPALGFYTPPASAIEFNNLWKTGNQQAHQALENGDATTAAEKFTDPNWKASAEYRAGDFDNAANSFAEIDTADAHYNRGNALARGGKLDEAIAAYKQALEINPEMQDATDNKALLEQLKEQQQDQEQQSGDKNEDGEQQENSEQESSDGESDEDSESNENSESGESGDSNQQNKPADDDKSGEENLENSAENEGNSEEEDSEQNPEETEEEQAQDSEAESEDEKESEDESSEQQEQTDKQGEDSAQTAAMEDTDMSPEEKQAIEQWLRQIPDDPGGLLRNKFKYQYQKNRLERIRKKLNLYEEQEERW